jgi:hypothetical protein
MIYKIHNKLQGGICIDFATSLKSIIFFYSNCSNVFVIFGKVIMPGQIMATLGKTGLNASVILIK